MKQDAPCSLFMTQKALKENMNPKTLDAHSHSFSHSFIVARHPKLF
jgi:hypothetical protein